jgi:hypothetical protein
MKYIRRYLALFFGATFLFSAALESQQPWSGIISPSRAANWSYAGLPGDVPPDASWTQCGTTIAAYGSSSSPGSPSTIQSAINSCGMNHYVLLGPGDFYLSGNVYLQSNMVLRGSGPNQTRMHIVSGTSNWGCNGPWGIVCIIGSNSSISGCTYGGISPWWSCPSGATYNSYWYQMANWTGGYSQGATTITLSNVTGIVLNQTPIVLSQCDTGFTGSSGSEFCNGGTAGGITAASVAAGGSGYSVGDTGTITCALDWGMCYGAGNAIYQVTAVSSGAVTAFNITAPGNGYTYTDISVGGTAATTAATSGSGSGFTVSITGINNNYDNGSFFICSINMICQYEGTSGSQDPGRSESEVVLATAISGSGPYTVTISTPLRNPNWSSSQSPQAYWGSSTITNAGVEDMLLDPSAVAASCVTENSAAYVWVTDIACNTANFFHVFENYVSNSLVRDSYFYWTEYAGTTSYGIGSESAVGNSLFENNIIQGVVDPLNVDGTCAGCVFAYNFAVNDYDGASSFLFASNPMHSAATNYILEEGNIGAGSNQDGVHGPHLADTYFRNYFTGYESNNGTLPTNTIIPAIIAGFSRYNNYLANVLGTAGIHVHYECTPSSASTVKCAYNDSWAYIWDVGWSHAPSMLDYGNSVPEPNDLLAISSLYRYGNYDVVNNAVQWNNSEVPTADPNFPNLVPSNNTFPSSFYNGMIGAYPSCGTGLPFWKNPTTGSCPPYPSIGPDVTNGDIGMCTSGTYQWSRALNSSQCAGGTFSASVNGGYGNSNPAMRCYLNQMAGPPDGTGSMLTFNPAACYASDTSTSSQSPAPPTGVNAVAVPN